MSVNQVSICNSALAKIGADQISSITQDTKSATICNRLFNYIRDEVLRAHPWNFALKRTTLTPDSDTPDSEYDYQYQLPSDSLRVLETPEDDSLDWVVEGRKILTNEPEELAIKYIYRHEDPSEWDSMFAEAFAWRLAADLSYALTQSLPLFDYCMKQYKAMLAEARSIDGMEGKIKVLVADEWINARK